MFSRNAHTSLHPTLHWFLTTGHGVLHEGMPSGVPSLWTPQVFVTVSTIEHGGGGAGQLWKSDRESPNGFCLGPLAPLLLGHLL